MHSDPKKLCFEHAWLILAAHLAVEKFAHLKIYYNWEQSVEDEKKKIEEEEKRLEGEEMTSANINSSLLGESPDRMNTSVNMSMNTSVIGSLFGSLKKKKTKAVESIYACNEPKVKTFKL